MSTPDKTPTPQQAARRRLVRGAFAVPAVMTVVSGSAFATGSSMRCLANKTVGGPGGVPAANPSSVPIASGTVGGPAPADGWLRVELWHNASTGKYYVWGSDLQVYKRTGNSVYLGGSSYQEFDYAGNKTVGGSIADPGGLTRSGKFAGVQFNSVGNVVGVGVTSTGTSAVPSTCWSSFAPGLGA